MNDYNTTVVSANSIETKADTSTSIIVDFSQEKEVNIAKINLPVATDIVYKTAKYTDGKNKGDRLDLKMDIRYHPDSKKKNPCIVVVPGGGFTSSFRTKLPIVRSYLSSKGFAVAILEYHVIGQGLYADAIQDVNDGIRYIRTNASKYNIDPKHLVLLGNSAGGYIVSMTTLTENIPEFKGSNNLNYSTRVDAVVNMYGLSDLTKVAADYSKDIQAAHFLPTTAEAQYVNGVYSNKSINDNPETAIKANPVTYAKKNMPPFLFMQGDKDVIVSPSQTVLLHNALLSKGASSIRYSLANDGHGTRGFDTFNTLNIIKDFIIKYTKQ